MARSSAETASGEISATNNEEHSHAGVLFLYYMRSEFSDYMLIKREESDIIKFGMCENTVEHIRPDLILR